MSNKLHRDNQIERLREFAEMLQDIQLRASLAHDSMSKFDGENTLDKDVQDSFDTIFSGVEDIYGMAIDYLETAEVNDFMTRDERDEWEKEEAELIAESKEYERQVSDMWGRV